MPFRITMGMKMNDYRYNLMQSTNTLYNSQTQVETHRKFNSYAESPADATNAWRVRRNFMDNYSYRAENKDTTTRYQTAWLSMESIHTDLEQFLGKTSVIRAANGPTGEAKKELGGILGSTAETIIQAMNGAKYGDEFVFAGTNGTSPPFTWDGDKLLYRGINLTPPSMLGGSAKWPASWGSIPEEGSSVPSSFDAVTKDWKLADDGTLTYEVTEDDGTGTMVTTTKTASSQEKEWYIYFKNMQTLDKLSAETQYADLGMGMNEDENGMVLGTYFNNAIPGINMLGYGVDNDGDPKNLALVMKQFDALLSKVDENGFVPDSEGGDDRVLQLMSKFDDACELTLSGYTWIDAQAKFLGANGDTLEDQTYNLNEQIANLEQVDMADAITQWMWDYSCYNAALKIGTQLLGQSLLDYMS